MVGADFRTTMPSVLLMVCGALLEGAVRRRGGVQVGCAVREVGDRLR